MNLKLPKFQIATLTLIAFLALPGFLFSQAWNPFPGGGTYLYTFTQQNVADVWLHGVKVDSLGIAGGDSVYYLNKINRYAEINETIMGCNYPIYAFMMPILLEQDNYFGRKMIIRPTGDYDFVNTAGDTFRLKTQLPPGNSWTFATGITATLDSITSKPVLGVTDSVMYISLSNNHSIQLSKDHGFVSSFSFLQFVTNNQAWQTVDFDLWGIPGMTLGDTLPGARGVFNYDVGDEFGRVRDQSFAYGSASTRTFTHSEITGASPGATGVTYNSMQEKLVINQFPYSPIDSIYTPPSPTTGTINYADYALLDLLPYESDPGQLQGTQVQIGVRFSGTFNNRIEYLFDQIFYFDACIPALTRFEDVRLTNYADGLGSTLKSYVTNGESDFQRLYCYGKLTDSLGPCLNLGTLIGVDDGLGDILEVAVGPVPAYDRLQVEIENYRGFGGLELNVVDLKGRLVQQIHLAEGDTRAVLDVRDLEAGMYALQILSENGSIGWKKFVVQK